MILAPLGHNYIKSPLGQPIQRKKLGQSALPLGTSPLPTMANLEESDMIGDWSYSPRDKWGMENGQQRSTPPIQARQDSSFSTSQTINKNIVSKSNNISESITPEIQRSPSNTPLLSTPQISQENIIAENKNIAESTSPKIQRSPSDPSLSELPGYQDVYSENNLQSRPKFSLGKFTSNVIDNTVPIARKVIQRVNEITSPKSSNFSPSESVQPQEESLETLTPKVQRSSSEPPPLSNSQTTYQDIISDSNNISESRTPKVQRSPSETPPLSNSQATHQDIISDSNKISENITPEVQRSPSETPPLSNSQTTHQDIISDSNKISESRTPEVQRSPSETPPLSNSQTTHQDIISDSNNISETLTPEVQRSPSETPLSELPGYQDVYSENNMQSRPKFSLNKFASNTIDNTLPIARKIIQRVSEITSPKPSNLSPSESVQLQEESLESPTPEIQRSPSETPTLSTPQATHQDIISDSNNIAESPTPEIQRSPSETPTLSTPQATHQDIISDSNNIAESPTPEIQRSLSETPPISTQTDIAFEESPVTTLSEGRGFLQLQPLGQSQPLAKDSDYLPSSFVSTSLKEILDYSEDNNPSLIQKKEGTGGKTSKTSISPSETLDVPKSWANVSELIGDSSDTTDSGKTEDWGGFTGLMGDTNLLPESPPESNAIVQAKNDPIEGELLIPISFEEIEEEKNPSLPPTPQIIEQLSDLEQPIREEELEFLAQLVYRLVRSRLNIEREQQYNQLGGASFWLDTVYFARDEKNSLSSTAMLATLETVNPYTSDRLSILAREVYVLLQMRIECDRDRQGNYY